MAKLPTAKIGLLVSFVEDKSSDNKYVHIKAHPVVLDTEKPGSILNPRDHAWDYRVPHDLYLKDLEVNSQGDKDSRLSGGLYGFDVRYGQPFAVDLSDAKKMVKTLAYIDRRMVKLREQFGYPHTFTEFLSRVASAIGAKEIVYSDGTSRSWSYRDGGYTRVNLADGLLYVNGLIRKWSGKAEVERDVAV